jgi:hypothetical protein
MSTASTAFALPKRAAGRPTAQAKVKYEKEVAAFCVVILELRSGLGFDVGSRGWAYVCESHGLITKAEFDTVQNLINDCRKSGALPLDICLSDEARAFDNLQPIDGTSPEEEAECIVDYVRRAHLNYWPESFWEDRDFYVQMVVEKSTLKSLFAPVCAEFHVPLATAGGWSDINMRADMMRRFGEWEDKGKQCVLLYCGDHDPAGLHISDCLLSNMAELEGAVGWSPADLTIERFGLNFEFIEEHGLTWLDNLITKKGICLSSDRHPDHGKPYVQSYLKQFGRRKVEGEALVRVPEAGRSLCREAILKYVSEDAPTAYEAKLYSIREEVRSEVMHLIMRGVAP